MSVNMWFLFTVHRWKEAGFLELTEHPHAYSFNRIKRGGNKRRGESSRWGHVMIIQRAEVTEQ